MNRKEFDKAINEYLSKIDLRCIKLGLSLLCKKCGEPLCKEHLKWTNK